MKSGWHSLLAAVVVVVVVVVVVLVVVVVVVIIVVVVVVVCDVVVVVFVGRDLNSFLKLGGQVVMRHAAAARRPLLFCQSLGGGQLPPLPPLY